MTMASTTYFDIINESTTAGVWKEIDIPEFFAAFMIRARSEGDFLVAIEDPGVVPSTPYWTGKNVLSLDKGNLNFLYPATTVWIKTVGDDTIEILVQRARDLGTRSPT